MFIKIREKLLSITIWLGFINDDYFFMVIFFYRPNRDF